MKVLIIGGGGREHAIVQKISQGPKVEKLYYTPGNAGITKMTKCVDIGVMDFEKLVAFAGEQATDLMVIGSDGPPAAGAVDASESVGTRMFGPRKNAAILEASEASSKDLAKEYNILSAAYETLDSSETTLTYLEMALMSVVLRADGLALGKGVLIYSIREEIKKGVETLTLDKQLGSASDRTVAREFMTRREVSILSLVGGRTIKIMTPAQNHKRTKDGDQGLNMGGMGIFSPSPFYMDGVDAFCRKYAYQLTVDAMKVGGGEFKGITFFGSMLTRSGPKVLEHNTRFEDPETQVVLSRMKNDIAGVLEACVDGTPDQVEPEFENNAAVYAVPASDGYPEYYDKGYKIDGLDQFDGQDGYYVFHTGGRFDKDGNIVANDGGVLGVTAKGSALEEARENVYKVMKWVEFGSRYMRHDIDKTVNEAGVVM